MIPYSLIIKILIICGFLASGVFYLQNWKNKAVNKAILEITTRIQSKESEITIAEQKKIIQTQNKTIKNLQQIEKENYSLNIQISKLENIKEQQTLKDNIITDINEILSDFNHPIQ